MQNRLEIQKKRFQSDKLLAYFEWLIEINFTF